MKIEVDAHELALDGTTRNWIRCLITFATWNHEPRVEHVKIDLRQRTAEGGIRCALHAATEEAFWIQEEACGPTVAQAIQEACDRLEVSLFRSLESVDSEIPHLFAA